MSVSQLMPLKESNFRHHAGYEKCKSWVGMKSQTPKHVKNTLSKPETKDPNRNDISQRRQIKRSSCRKGCKEARDKRRSASRCLESGNWYTDWKKTSRLCSNMFEPGQNCCFTTIGCGSRLCGQTDERYTKDASRNTPRKLCKDQKINDNNRSKKIK